MEWSEKEILDFLASAMTEAGIPERLRSTGLMIARGMLREPGRSKQPVHMVLARIYEELRPSMTRDEWLTHRMRGMSDRQLMEAIYRKVSVDD